MNTEVTSLREVSKYFLVTEHTVSVVWRERHQCPELAEAPYDLGKIAEWFRQKAPILAEEMDDLEKKKIEADLEKMHREKITFWIFATAALGPSAGVLSREVREWIDRFDDSPVTLDVSLGTCKFRDVYKASDSETAGETVLIPPRMNTVEFRGGMDEAIGRIEETQNISRTKLLEMAVHYLAIIDSSSGVPESEAKLLSTARTIITLVPGFCLVRTYGNFFAGRDSNDDLGLII